MKSKFTITIEKEVIEGLGERWSAICPELWIFIEENSAEEARKTALDFVPEMYAHYLEDQAAKKTKLRKLQVQVIDKVTFLPADLIAC